jgi:hypothetical protein
LSTVFLSVPVVLGVADAIADAGVAVHYVFQPGRGVNFRQVHVCKLCHYRDEGLRVIGFFQGELVALNLKAPGNGVLKGLQNQEQDLKY